MVELEIIAMMVVPLVFIITTGAVILLRPLSRRLGDLLEVYARERERGLEGGLHQTRELLENLNSRLQLLEERQDFMERLLQSGEKKSVPEE
ncbi:MAG: hypothetical protein OEZ65_13600 [Gemmatimonadota bacterium]|nr:hypothetical protein [Gemmatimonadota bacterium]